METIRGFLLYRYHDTPEGQDCFHKTFYLAKWSGVAGCFVAYYDAIANRHLVPGWRLAAFFVRSLRLIVPFTACGAFFGASTCLIYAYRKKEDSYNYMASGLATGVLWGAMRRSNAQGYGMAILLVLAAFWNRQARQSNSRVGFYDPILMIKYKREDPTLWFRNLDFTVLKTSKWEPKTKTYHFPASIAPLPAPKDK